MASCASSLTPSQGTSIYCRCGRKKEKKNWIENFSLNSSARTHTHTHTRTHARTHASTPFPCRFLNTFKAASETNSALKAPAPKAGSPVCCYPIGEASFLAGWCGSCITITRLCRAVEFDLCFPCSVLFLKASRMKTSPKLTLHWFGFFDFWQFTERGSLSHLWKPFPQTR